MSWILLAADGTWSLKSLLLVAIAIAVGVLGLAIVERIRAWRSQAAPTPESLFNQLCDAHELTRAERTLLSEAAATLPPGSECRVFFDPLCLERHAPPDGPDGETARQLAKKLFE